MLENIREAYDDSSEILSKDKEYVYEKWTAIPFIKRKGVFRLKITK